MEGIKNLENFKRFLDENLKEDYNGNYDLNSYVEDLKEQYCETGMCDYELPKFESKSGNPEIFKYEIEIEFLKNGDADIQFIF